MSVTTDSFEPRIVGFLCNWCSYAGADAAGTSRLKYATNLRVIRDPESPSGWKLEIGPFPGWETVPTW